MVKLAFHNYERPKQEEITRKVKNKGAQGVLSGEKNTQKP